MSGAYGACSFIGEGMTIYFENRTEQTIEVRVQHETSRSFGVVEAQSREGFGFTDPPETEFWLVIRIADGPVILCRSLTEKTAHGTTIVVENVEPLLPLPAECEWPS